MAWYPDTDNCLISTFTRIGEDIAALQRLAEGGGVVINGVYVGASYYGTPLPTIRSYDGRTKPVAISSFEVVRINTEGVTLSKLVWGMYHEPKPGLVEQIMHFNPRIAAFGEYLPPGLEVLVPVENSAGEETTLETVSLWD